MHADATGLVKPVHVRSIGAVSFLAVSPEVMQLAQVADLQVGSSRVWDRCFRGSSQTVNIPASRPPAISDDWLSPIIAAWRPGHPSLSMATRKRVGSGLPIAIGLGATCHGNGSSQGTTAGVEETRADREPAIEVHCEERCARGDCTCGRSQPFVIEIEVDSDDDCPGFLPALDRNRRVTGIGQHAGKVFGADNQDRDGPQFALDFAADQVKRSEDLAGVGCDAKLCKPLAQVDWSRTESNLTRTRLPDLRCGDRATKFDCAGKKCWPFPDRAVKIKREAPKIAQQLGD